MRVQARWAELQLALMLLSRLPVGRVSDPAPRMAEAAWAYPLAGALAALPAALVFVAVSSAVPPLLAAALALAVLIVTTGGLHEDGLADLCDGLGGGKTPARKLEIMRDSRIGSYGALGLGLALILRVGGLAAAPDAGSGVMALLVIGAASRAALPLVMAVLPPARTDGLGAGAAGPDHVRVAAALGLGLLALVFSASPFYALVWIAAAVATLSWLSRRQIGGFTGDTLGATQQVAECAAWVVFSAAWYA